MKVYLAECGHPSSVSPRTISVLRSANGSERITGSAAEADVVLFIDFPSDDGFRDLRQHPVLNAHRRKSILYSQDDIPLAFLPGLFGCTPRGWNLESRARGAHFILPFDARHEPEPRERTLLFSFMGGPTGPFRKKLLAADFAGQNAVVMDTSGYRHWDPAQSRGEKGEWQRKYRDTMLASQFVLCPRGAGNGSIRLFEVMQMGRAPVILADGWMPPHGPDWQSFALFVSEDNLDGLPFLLEKHASEVRERGRMAREAWESWFRPENSLDWLLNQADEMWDADRQWDHPMFWSAWAACDQAARSPRMMARSLRNRLRGKTELPKGSAPESETQKAA